MSATRINHRLNSEVGLLKNDLHKVRRDLGEIASTLLDEGRAKASAARHDVQERFEKSFENARGFMRERPVTTALAAMGAGLVIGWLFRKS